MDAWYKAPKEYKMLDKKALIEQAKSIVRGLYFAFLGFVGTFLTSLIASQDLQNTVIHVADDIYLPVGALLVAVLALVVKNIDGLIHKSKKIKSNGLAPEFLQR